LLYEGGAEPDVKDEPEVVRPRISYHFMDGIRGTGALAVYLCHFKVEFFSQRPGKEGNIEYGIPPPTFFAYPPFALFYNGYLWVKVFFILSGFVLPLNFFKTGRYSCLTGGVMRRYFRLMLPVLMILSIYLFFARFDFFGESTFNKIKNKTFLSLLYTAMLEIWAGPDISFIEPTWTLGIEFWATYLIYIVAFTSHAYRGRFFFYTALIFFFWSIEYLGFLNLIPWKTGKVHV
jgi:peptidoglycan/LPS O-acetylase OafA/YrhL